MQCPHCGLTISPHWAWGTILPDASDDDLGWGWRMAVCPGSDCGNTIIKVGTFRYEYDQAGLRSRSPAWDSQQDYLVWPRTTQRVPLGDEVPEHIKDDYREACTVLPVSAKASAALSRRALESILNRQGYNKGKLFDKIKAARSKGNMPSDLQEALHTARRFGNLSAHPPADDPIDRIVDVETGEAEWCLDILDRLITHYYGSCDTATQDADMKAWAAQLEGNRKPTSDSSAVT